MLAVRGLVLEETRLFYQQLLSATATYWFYHLEERVACKQPIAEEELDRVLPVVLTAAAEDPPLLVNLGSWAEYFAISQCPLVLAKFKEHRQSHGRVEVEQTAELQAFMLAKYSEALRSPDNDLEEEMFRLLETLEPCLKFLEAAYKRHKSEKKALFPYERKEILQSYKSK